MYDSDYFKTVDRSYSSFDILRLKTVVNILKDLPKGSLCMDAGAGAGHYLGFLGERFSNVVGFEFSKDGIRQSRESMKDEPFIINGSLLERLPFEDNLFDFILCSETLEHLDGLEIALDELKRVLKKCGKLLITVPNFTKLSFEYIREIVSGKDPTHIHRYNFCRWEKILSRHFKIKKITSSSFIPSFPLYSLGVPHGSILRLEGLIRKIPLLKALGRECIFLLEKS